MIVASPRVIARLGALEALSTLPEVSGARVLLVSDSGLFRAGHAARAATLLDAAGAEVRLFTRIAPNPTPRHVAACLAAAAGVEAFVAVGGGSVMDVAKLAALLASAGGEVADHVGVHETTRDARLVLVPTTAGTGSDGQASAIVRLATPFSPRPVSAGRSSCDPATHRKMACLAPGLAADVVLLDAELTVTCPPDVTAASGLDALTHAVEVAVTTRRNPESDALSTRAFVAIERALPVVLAEPDNLEARDAMLRAAHDAGRAIAHAMLGAAHAAGNALTARYGLPHGLAVGRMLPAVVRHNAGAPEAAACYAALASAAGLEPSAEALALRLDALVVMAGGSKVAVDEADIPGLAAEAASQWTGTFNPRPMDEAAYAALFSEVGR